ncbi:MAG TPA: SLC13 family permease [Pararhizobium sp.]|nr:SLC13 family permease [Pararhizobium sp.]
MALDTNDILIWVISALAVGGVIIRPFGVSEWIFAIVGAAVMAAAGLISPAEFGRGVLSGLDVYLFLAGMMLLAELARREGLFDYLAALAARQAGGSPKRLFALTYLVGVLVTVFLSNDATAVVLTPAVAAVARAAEAKSPMPYLLICAFVANAASFVLPISNPANLVIFGTGIPPLGAWLGRFAAAAAVAIIVTYFTLYFTQRRYLSGRIAESIAVPALGRGGRIAAAGLVCAGIVLLVASASGVSLGWPTAVAGSLTVLAVLMIEGRSPWPVVRSVSWSTLILVAGLFVIVRAIEDTGLKALFVADLEQAVRAAPDLAASVLGVGVGFLANLTNNLPLGLIGGGVVAAADVPKKVADAVLIGIDLGPNLSVTGSLATIIWLTALRRENLSFGALRFLAIGIVVMPPALILALAVRMLLP